MTLFLHLAALAAVVAGAACLYLASPHRQWPAPPWSGPAGRAAGLGLFALGWLIWCIPLQPPTAFFAVLSVAQASLILLPLAAALATARRRRES